MNPPDDAAALREYGLQFDRVADAYDERRPSYPPELIDAVCEHVALQSGDRVLEVGCGTGQLTAALVGRGLDVLAVEPGPSMIERAQLRLGRDAAEFICGRFEEVSLPAERFAAVFSASAFHWVDPTVGWAKAASLLRPGGSLALIQYCSGADRHSIGIELELLRALTAIAPEVASTLPKPRMAEAALAGARQRAHNLSEVWSWISGRDLAVSEAAGLYGHVDVLSEVVDLVWTADELNAHLRTTSLSFRLGPERTAALESETRRVFAHRGGKLCLPELIVAVTARRAREG